MSVTRRASTRRPGVWLGEIAVLYRPMLNAVLLGGGGGGGEGEEVGGWVVCWRDT
jgi:hypothetical protein